MNQRSAFWIVVCLTLSAFLLRLVDLDGRSLWLDESFTLLRTQSAWSDIFNNIVIRQNDIRTTDINPPLYFALLKAWGGAAGESTFALRIFSALFAVLIVPLSYALGRRLTANAHVGLISAGLALFNPSYQWYASEIRAYALLPFLGAASTYILLKLSRRSSNLVLVALWIAISILSILTHYSFVGLVAAQALWVLIKSKIFINNIKRKSVLRTLFALGLFLFALTLTAPLWLPTQSYAAQLALQALTRPSGPGASLLDWLAEIVSAAAFGFNAGDPSGRNGPLTVLIGLSIVIGLNAGLSKINAILLYKSIFFPILFWFILSFFIENQPSFRYVIFIFPLISICTANALVLLNRIAKVRLLRPAVQAFGALLVFGSAVFGTAMTFVRTPSWHDDWRSLAQHVRGAWHPDDALVISLYAPESVLDLYLGDLPIDVIPIHTLLRLPATEAREHLEAHYRRLWYTNVGGDRGLQNPEAQALFGPYSLRSRTSFPGRTNSIELLEYELRPFVSDQLPAQAVAVADANISQTHITGYEVAAGNPYHPYPNLWLHLYWRRGGDEDFTHHTVALRLRDAQTTWWDWSIPAGLTFRPAGWHAGTVYRTSHFIPLPLGLPLQPYQLDLRLLIGPKAEPAQIASVTLDEQVVRCCLRIRQWPGRGDQDLRRLADVALLAEYPPALRPNQPLPVVLTWYPVKPHLTAWQTRLRVEGLLGGGTVATVERSASTSAFPVAAWPADEPVRDPYVLALPPALSPGIYRVSLERWRDGHSVDGMLLGLLRVEDYPYEPVARQVQHPLAGRAGELELLGYSVSGMLQRGRVVEFITHWRAIGTPKRDGTIFLHMLSEQGQLISQDDNPPIVDGLARSTLTYRPGEGINQIHRLAIPADLAPGQYRLYAGIYDRQGLERWPAQQNAQPAKDNLIYLGTTSVR